MRGDEETMHDAGSPAPPPPSSGDLFANRYLIEREIGRGGMGMVFAARDQTLGEVVALKTAFFSESSDIDQFRREVRLARRVTHPNVARTFDVGEHDGTHFLTMEYVRGKSLEKLLEERGTIDWDEAQAIILSIGHGLGAAHRAGVIHRDIKPANIIVGDDGRVVLSDFGIARSGPKNDTSERMLVGTPDYMAPEQVSLGRSDTRSDVFSLGVVAYEITTGHLPWFAESAMESATIRLTETAATLEGVPGVPSSAVALVQECLSIDPNERPHNAVILCARFHDIADGGVAYHATPRPGPLYAPLLDVERTIAILPFRYRGDPEHSELGNAIAEELIDTLSRTKDVHVLSLGATLGLGADPTSLRALGANVIVHGSVHYSEGAIRIAARLTDPVTGIQQWHGTFSGQLGDVMAMQDSIGKRVAETLRVEIDARRYLGVAPPEAIELYMRARVELRNDLMGDGTDALPLLDKCVELAPSFGPGLAAHALAAVHAWWSLGFGSVGDLATTARESVARAISMVPELADTHLASATLFSQEGRPRDTAKALGEALRLAPTMSQAQMRLGALQVEAGRVEEGLRRLKMALVLDPSLPLAQFTLARTARLLGRPIEAEAHLAELSAKVGATNLPVLLCRLRWALYEGDLDPISEYIAALTRNDGPNGTQIARLFAPALAARTGELSVGAAIPMIFELSGSRARGQTNLRLAALTRQLAMESLTFAGATEAALDVLELASQGALVDIEWLERCTLLEPLRRSPRYETSRREIARRAENVWI